MISGVDQRGARGRGHMSPAVHEVKRVGNPFPTGTAKVVLGFSVNWLECMHIVNETLGAAYHKYEGGLVGSGPSTPDI